MDRDILEQLAEVEVPAPPPHFDRQVHDRLNTLLTVGHLADLATRGVAMTFIHLGRALLGGFALTMTGRYDGGPRKHDHPRR